MGIFSKITDSFIQTSEETKLASHVKNFVETSRSHPARVANEAIWMTNIAALCGFSGFRWNSAMSTFAPINDPFWSTNGGKVIVNKILPTAQNRLARLCKSPPRFDVRPEGNDTESKDQARISLNTLTALWEQLEVNQRRIALKMWVQQCGHAWMRVGWNPKDGATLTDPMTGEKVNEGAPFVEEMPPFEVFPPPNCKTEEEVLSIGLATAKVRPLEYFRERFERGSEVKEESAWLQSIQYENQVNNMTSSAGVSTVNSSGTNMLKNSAIELVKYEAPSKKHPEGRMITVANGIVLENKPLPIGEIPFRKFDDIAVAGKLYSEAIITHLRPISDQYNRVIGRRSDWTNKMLAGKWITARGSGLTQEAIDDTNGEVIEYDVVPNAPDGGRPVSADIPTIPSYAYTEEETLNSQFADVSGLQEVSQGKAPSAQMPAIGMSLLQEQDETRIGIMIMLDEMQLAKIGSLILKFFAKFATTPRKLKVGGKLGQYDVQLISGENVGESTDVVVIPGSTYPGSKTLKREEVFRLYSAGFLGDPADPKVKEKALEMMEYGEVGDAWLKQSLIDGQIKRAIKRLEAGETVVVSKFDNHFKWLDQLDDLRLSEKAENDPELMSRVVDLMDQIFVYVQDQAVKAAGVPPPDPMPEPPMDEGNLDPAMGAEVMPPEEVQFA